MEKRFIRYFGNNIGRKLYIVSLVLVVIGALVGYFYWWYYGMPIAILGVIGFLVTSGIQVSDKDIDEHISNSVDKFKDSLNGRSVGKERLDSRDFSFFNGFIREDSSTRFVAGRDGRVRTSKYYITAISTENGRFRVFTETHDLLSEQAADEARFEVKESERVELVCTPVDFPAGNKKYEIKAESGEKIVFYLPNDALADKLISFLK